jgi:D-3-phosphoglycerate dehydrogenase / 2-oxoglutarate reductase
MEMENKYQVVVTDCEFPDFDQEKKVIENLGGAFVLTQCKTENELIIATEYADGILNQYAKVNSRVIEAMKKCKVIVRYGIGVDTIDMAAATKAGIPVCNVPLYGIHEVSDHVIALLFSCIRKLVPMNAMVKKNSWDYKFSRPISRIQGKTIGFVGFGNIPKMISKKLKPWDLRMLACDPFVSKKICEEFGVKKVSLDLMLKECDYISLHAPLTPETRYLFNYEKFRSMKQGAVFINTSRGAIVEEQGLYKALQEGWLAGAGLDVLEKEPPLNQNPLFDLDNIILTPHMAWHSADSEVDLQRMAAEEVMRVLRGDKPLSCLNSEVLA